MKTKRGVMNFVLSVEGIKSLMEKPVIIPFFALQCGNTTAKKSNFTETITSISKKDPQGSLLILANSLLRKPGVLLLRKTNLISK